MTEDAERPGVAEAVATTAEPKVITPPVAAAARKSPRRVTPEAPRSQHAGLCRASSSREVVRVVEEDHEQTGHLGRDQGV